MFPHFSGCTSWFRPSPICSLFFFLPVCSQPYPIAQWLALSPRATRVRDLNLILDKCVCSFCMRARFHMLCRLIWCLQITCSGCVLACGLRERRNIPNTSFYTCMESWVSPSQATFELSDLLHSLLKAYTALEFPLF